MMKFLVVVILAVGGFFAYSFFFAGAGPAPAVGEAVPTQGGAGVEAEAGSDGGQPNLLAAAVDEADGDGDGTLDERGEDARPPEEPAGRDLGTLLKSAEQRFAAISKGSGSPYTHPDAVAVARDYSTVLKATYNKPEHAKLQLQLISRLSKFSKAFFFSPTPIANDASGLIKMIEIDQSDLNKIGRKYGMSYQHINILRGTDPEDGLFHMGDMIKVLETKKQGGFLLHIDKSDFYMDLYIGKVFAARFPVGHGEENTPTPTGTTFIEAREKYPQWTDPKTNKVYQYGEEGHILGPVWLAFNKQIGRSGLGIHGYTGEGPAVGGRYSNGCIRMKNEHAMMLYNILVPCGQYQSGFISRAPMKVEVVD